MPLPTVSFVIGLAVLFYLCTFVIFALLRIITGISIQRLSWGGLRRIAYSPRDGLTLRIRGMGISLHRPTFAQPTWVSLTLTEPQIILDLAALQAAGAQSDADTRKEAHEKEAEDGDAAEGVGRDAKRRKRVHMFERLIGLKEKLKRLHRQIDWLRNVDLVMLRSSIVIKNVGSLRMERFTLSVDTRSKTVDRRRLFQHHKTVSDTRRPAEWMAIVRSILLTVDGKESTELLDYCTISVHGFLYKELDGLRDASIAVKMGRITAPYDDIQSFIDGLKSITSRHKIEDEPRKSRAPRIMANGHDISDSEVDPLDTNAVEAINDSKDFASSILRGIQEVQLAVGSFGLSKRIRSLARADRKIYFNLAMKEVGLDLMRLDPTSPSHRMYFSPKDVAHQALVTAISIAAGLDDGTTYPERTLYVPMVTATVKTTLPSKIVQVSVDADDTDKNTNILFANLVCTSPSVDLDPKHLPLILAIIKAKTSGRSSDSRRPAEKRHIPSSISRLLPKAIVKVAVQETVIRVSLPHRGEETEYDMIISSVSSITLDIDAQHDTKKQHHYSVSVNYRHTSHRLYGQTYEGTRHELLFADTVEIKLDVNAFPEISVLVAGKFQNFSLFLTQPEICEGIRQIVITLRKELLKGRSKKNGVKQSFLRRAPAWLQHVRFEGSDFNVEITSVEASVSKYARGVSFHLESWSIDHKVDREDIYSPITRRRSTSRTTPRDRSPSIGASRSPRRKPSASPTDGRRLAVHVDGFEGLIIDGMDKTKGDPFVALPRFEVAFSTSTDPHGQISHINASTEKLFLHYSMYNHFAVGMAALLMKKTFAPQMAEFTSPRTPDEPSISTRQNLILPNSPEAEPEGGHAVEIVTVDFRAALIQIKANMPSDPPMMLQIASVEAGRHRWAAPFGRSRLIRLYAGTPGNTSTWSRIVVLKAIQFNVRTMKRKVGRNIVDDRSFDIALEAVRISVPHELVVHSIFDNISNVFKVTQQLHHRFKTGAKDYILKKAPEGPKRVPKISLRTQVLAFEIEDSPFEYRLGLIYRTGLVEQRQRLARRDAFDLKVKRMNLRSNKKGSSRARARSARPPQQGRHSAEMERERPRSQSANPPSMTPRDARRSRFRYDAEGKSELDGTTTRSVDQAREVLDRFNAASWRSRIDRAFTFQRNAMKEVRTHFFGMDEIEDQTDEAIVPLTQRPGLAVFALSDFAIVVDKPTFALHDLPNFLHESGNGMPLDMEYSLLIPMHLQISVAEARGLLRDYPLPLIHIPALRSGQSSRLPTLSLTTDFVIAEEFRDEESQRHVNIQVIPKDKLGPGDTGEGFNVDVMRTISSIKTYSNMKIDINTSAPTRITWSTSYQPAIQDMMQVIEGFTKPPIDPSDRVGFWDKIRLAFHSRIIVSWKGDGDVQLNFKGSRDPYVVTGDGAGFVMVWRNNVCWKIAQDEDPKKFMTVDSGDYILAIPDFDHYARHVLDTDESVDASASSADTLKSAAMFKKVVMKLSGNVQWLLGLTFEQAIEDGKRRFDFRPHYDVVLKHPDHAKAPPGKTYDAYHGFRSQHIHMSIAIAAPHARDWDVLNSKPSDNYNSVHLSPRAFTHFLKWWSLFSGVMSLPVRQGRLWGSQEKSSKKFGRHLATIKYNLLLSPLFISHMYKHKDAEDYASTAVAVTGLKMKIDSFMLDLHQRREFFSIPTQGGDSKTTSGMRINQGQLDFISADFRAISASVKGTGKSDIDSLDDAGISSYQSAPAAVDMSRFAIPDNDFTWIDMDDFVELDWVLPQESNPETKILPLGNAPRFTYFRQTDHSNSSAGDVPQSSPFGDEATHYCVMTRKNDPRRVQADLIKERLDKIVKQIDDNERTKDQQELRIIRETSDHSRLKQEFDTLKQHAETLQKKHAFLNGMLKALLQRLEDDDKYTTAEERTSMDRHEREWRFSRGSANTDEIPNIDESSDFNNRFVVHNAQIKWNNSLRNIILRYIHQVGQRRGFVYYMSRRAVKFILDIVEEKKKASNARANNTDAANGSDPTSPQQDDDMTVEDQIAQILADGKDFVEADDEQHKDQTSKGEDDHRNEEISTEFVAQNTYHFRLIAPQIQLQSEKNPKSAVLIAAKGMHLKVVQIMDKHRVLDEVSGLVQRRFSAAMDSMQVFVTSTKTFSMDYLHMYSGNRYGTKVGSYWPPWVPMEVMYEFSNNPYGFSRVVQRTSASLRLDKYNNLRLKYNDDVSKSRGDGPGGAEVPEHRMDHLSIEFPQFRAICDSPQYHALYIIAMDLLLYNEPLEKTRSERLEKIMLASDFSDLTGAPEMVEMLQARIRQLEEIKMHFQIHERLLDRQGWKDRISMDQDLASCEDELFFMMKAITTSQQKADDRGVEDGTSGILRWMVTAKELAWHLVREHEQKFLEFQIRDTSFERTDNNDGSNQNSVSFGRINGYNFLPNAVYHELIAPYVEEKTERRDRRDKMLRVQWLMLEAIAGIPVVDYFEVDMVPVRVQLEREVAKRLFEYIFPGVGESAFEGSGFSPFVVKKMLPSTEESSDEDDQGGRKTSDSTTRHAPAAVEDLVSKHQGTGTGCGTLEARLQPTLRLSEAHKHSPKPKQKGLGLSDAHGPAPHWSLFQHKNRSAASLASKMTAAIGKSPNPSMPHLTRTSSEASTENVADSGLLTPSTAISKSGKNISTSSLRKSSEMTRSSSTSKKKKGSNASQQSDDLTQMLSRASSYITLSYFHINSLILCLSYKGQGKRNIEDVHDLVFRLPAIEYRNKTWSNLDIAMELKKEVLRALVGHAGRIVSNKFRSAPKKVGNKVDAMRESLLLGNGNVTSLRANRRGSVSDPARSPAISEDLSVDRGSVTELISRDGEDFGRTLTTMSSSSGKDPSAFETDPSISSKTNGRAESSTSSSEDCARAQVQRSYTAGAKTGEDAKLQGDAPGGAAEQATKDGTGLVSSARQSLVNGSTGHHGSDGGAKGQQQSPVPARDVEPEHDGGEYTSAPSTPTPPQGRKRRSWSGNGRPAIALNGAALRVESFDSVKSGSPGPQGGDETASVKSRSSRFRSLRRPVSAHSFSPASKTRGSNPPSPSPLQSSASIADTHNAHGRQDNDTSNDNGVGAGGSSGARGRSATVGTARTADSTSAGSVLVHDISARQEAEGSPASANSARRTTGVGRLLGRSREKLFGRS